MEIATRIKFEIIIIFVLLFASVYCYKLRHLNYINIDISPTLEPTRIPPMLDTFDSIISMAYCIQEAMKHTKYTNVFDYFNSKTNINTIPKILDYKILSYTFNDCVGQPSGFRQKGLLDTWGNLIIISLTKNKNGEIGMTMHSYGKNKKNETGKGDDILIWFNADMSSSDLDNYNLPY